MKRTLLTIALTLSVIGTLRAESVAWDVYHTKSAEARTSLKALESAVSFTASSALTVTAQYKALAEEARTLGRPDLAIWSLNNAAFANIILFKKLVNYGVVVKSIEALPSKSKERIAAVKALQATYASNRSLLEDSISLLDDAVRLSNDSKTDKVQEKKIDSNRAFAIESLLLIEQKF